MKPPASSSTSWWWSSSTPSPPPPQSTDAQVGVLLRQLYPIIILNTIATGMTWPALPAIAMHRLHDDIPAVATFFGRINAANAILDFFTNPALGALSDSRGRRPLLLQSLAVATICNTLVALWPSPRVIFLTKVLFGICNVTKAMGYSMLVDAMDAAKVSRPARVEAFGRIGMAIGAGFSLGPLIGGLIGTQSPVITVAVAAVIMACATCWAYLVLPETLAPHSGRPPKPLRYEIFASCRHTAMLWHPRLVTFALSFLLAAVAAGPYAIWYVYAQARFGWGGLKNGAFLAGYGAMAVLAQGVLLPRLTPTHLSEQSVVFVGFMSNSALFAMFGTLDQRNNGVVFALLPICLFGALSEPVLRHVFTQLVPPEDQGALQGAIASLSTIGNACGPLLAARLLSFGARAPCTWIAAVIGGCGNLAALPCFFSSALFLASSFISQCAFTTHLQTFSEHSGEKRIESENESLLQLEAVDNDAS
jgi:DHA1 family tetracycline resistance protein-like MFS transporter